MFILVSIPIVFQVLCVQPALVHGMQKSRREVSKAPLCSNDVTFGSKTISLQCIRQVLGFFCEETNISFCP